MMRPAICCLALLIALVPATGRADAKPPTQALSFDPLWVFYSTASFQYERLMAPNGSLAIKARLGRRTVNPADAEPYERTLIGLGFGYHLFPQKGAPMGFYAAPGIDLLQRYKTTKTGTASVFVAVPFAEFGYNWSHSLGIYAGGSIGIQYIIGRVDDDLGGLETLKGVVPRVSLHLGYAW